MILVNKSLYYIFFQNLYHYQHERLQRRELMRLTWTTKHRFSSFYNYCCLFFAQAHKEGNDLGWQGNFSLKSANRYPQIVGIVPQLQIYNFFFVCLSAKLNPQIFKIFLQIANLHFLQKLHNSVSNLQVVLLTDFYVM